MAGERASAVELGANCCSALTITPGAEIRTSRTAVNILVHLRYRCVRISVVFHLLDTLDFGGVGGFRRGDHLSHVGTRVVPRLWYHNRI